MNGKSDETLSRKSEERTSSRVEPIFGLFRVRSEQSELMRSETPETASQHASLGHWDDNADDSGPTVA